MSAHTTRLDSPGARPSARAWTSHRGSRRSPARSAANTCIFTWFGRIKARRVEYKANQEALRSAAARRERRTSLLLGASVMLAGSIGELFYRPFQGPLLAVRVLWCASMFAIGLALPRASARWV